jgi:LEA14-like dessication related protein
VAAPLVSAPESPPEASAPARPEVRAPDFRIESVSIKRDLLVTTKLRLSLAIDNPNDFPIELSAFSYQFYGEGKLWTEGSSEDAVPESSVPAHGSLERKLSFTMNFASMDRRLFDLVAKLKVVRYRLKGTTRISTGIESLPDFPTSFDNEGTCAVER